VELLELVKEDVKLVLGRKERGTVVEGALELAKAGAGDDAL